LRLFTDMSLQLKASSHLAPETKHANRDHIF